jgi:hypothetical protein
MRGSSIIFFMAASRVAYKALTEPSAPVNEGSFAALKTIIPEGNVMMAQYPAPMGGWSLIVPTVVDTIFKALAGLARFFCYAGLTDNPWRAYAFVDDAWPIALSVAGRRLRRAGDVHLADGLYKPWCA